MMLLLLACESEPLESGEAEEPAGHAVIFPTDTTGFTATSLVAASAWGETRTWCSVSFAITGTRQDDACPACDYAFTLASVPTYTEGSEDDCGPPILATMMPDEMHVDPFLGYYAYNQESGRFEQEWYVGYTPTYTTTQTGDFTRRFFSESEPGVETTADGFAWAGDLSWSDWWPQGVPLLWTVCSDYVNAEGGDWEGEPGAPVTGEVIEDGSFFGYGDRWLLPLVEGDVVNLMAPVEDRYEKGYVDPVRMYLVRPDGCLGQSGNGEGSDFGSFTANVSGDWHVAIAPYWQTPGLPQVYQLSVRVNGVDVTPTLADDGVQLYKIHDGSATIEGIWLR